MSRYKSNRSNKRPKTSGKVAGKTSFSQVRIIGGRFKRQSVSFIDAEGLRPTPDRLRETLFNWLHFDLHDANVLDPCAGSGVLGFEALSRGARHTTFIEIRASQAALLQQTADKLNLSSQNVSIFNGDALNVLSIITPPIANNTLPTDNTLATDAKALHSENTLKSTTNNHADNATNNENTFFHLVFLDPPYDLALWQPIIDILLTRKLVTAETLFYIEDKRPLQQTLDDLPYDYQVIKQTKVGQIYASFVHFTSI